MLLEVMLAVAVVAGGIVVLVQACAASLRAAKVSRERFQQGLRLEEKMWELEQTGSLGEIPSQEDVQEQRVWDLKETPSAEGLCDRRDLSLAWGQEKKRRELSLTTYELAEP